MTVVNAWDKFDKAIDTKALQKDVAEAADGQASYKEVPHGTYVVKIEKLELVESKKGSPMVSCWMSIVEGEFKNNKLFMNQVLTTGFGIHMANEFVRSLDSGIEIDFDTFSQYGQLLMDVHEEIENLEYEIEYGEKKGYSTFKVLEVFDK